MLLSNVVFLCQVGLQIIKLQRFTGLRPYRFPSAHAYGLLETALVKLPVQEIMLVRLSTSQQRREQGSAIELIRDFGHCNVRGRRQKIPERRNLIADPS